MKTVVITGITRGIGLATARRFLDNGWNVVGTWRGSEAPLSAPVSGSGGASGTLTQVELDISSSTDIARAAQEIAEKAPSIDVLVNNAGVLLDSDEDGINMEKLRATFDVNLFGLIDLTERLVPRMHAGSHIINLDSGHGAMSIPIDDATSSAYRMSKAALNMYTRTAAFRLKEKGIIVSSIAPGWVKTAMGNSLATDAEKPDRTPEDAAEDIYQLAISNPESGFFWEFGKKREW